MNQILKKKILFVGASGAVASKVIPSISNTYDIVGLVGKRRELEKYCVDFYVGDLLREYKEILNLIFKKHKFDSIVWNPVRYFPGPLLKSSREALHTEFDLAVALPIECLRMAVKHSFGENCTFLLITSQLGLGKKPGWGSYSIVKRGQFILNEYLAVELFEKGIFPKTLALGSVPKISEEILTDVIIRAIENNDPSKLFYLVHPDSWV